MSPHTNAAARAYARVAAVDKTLGRRINLACGHHEYRDTVTAWTGSRSSRRWYCGPCDSFQPEVKRRWPHRHDCIGCWRCSEDPVF